jgi:hypothetical protein
MGTSEDGPGVDLPDAENHTDDGPDVGKDSSGFTHRSQLTIIDGS